MGEGGPGAASRRPDDLSPLGLGYRYDLTRQWNRAVEQYHNALELDPHYAVAHNWLGLVCLQTGESGSAIRAMETYVRGYRQMLRLR